MTQQHNYGQTFDEVSRVRHPQGIEHAWGRQTLCSDRPEFLFYRLDLKTGHAIPLSLFRSHWVSYLLETGSLTVRNRSRQGGVIYSTLEAGQVFHNDVGVPHSLFAGEESVIYAFTGPGALSETVLLETPQECLNAFHDIPGNPAQGESTTDFRDKYWGTIETIIDREVAGKRIKIRAGTQSSLEYHLHKTEAYFIHSGKIRVGLRVGRAANRSIVLNPGDVFEVDPGTMHMRIGIEDSVVIEVSTRDDDADSHLVEDGMSYRHIEKD